jgi:hypothetical protein
MVRQIPTDSMKRYIRLWVQERGFCPFAMPANGESYCHFLHPGYCPYGMMEKEETRIFDIPHREFYRCLL